jgi:hypothetical protein
VVDLPTFESSPLPVRYRITSYGSVINATQTLRVCEAGKSFVVDKQSHCKRIQGIAKRLGISITTKKIEDGRYRIWRKP